MTLNRVGRSHALVDMGKQGFDRHRLGKAETECLMRVLGWEARRAWNKRRGKPAARTTATTAHTKHRIVGKSGKDVNDRCAEPEDEPTTQRGREARKRGLKDNGNRPKRGREEAHKTQGTEAWQQDEGARQTRGKGASNVRPGPWAPETAPDAFEARE
ncbi:hypothetical protein ERJ75_001281000 [Trypanosoma vivax]|nr:hypothetical protein ERJ75_001281000 [Trypanosoma vivax]